MERIKRDIIGFIEQYPAASSVLINLLPAAPTRDLNEFEHLSQLYSKVVPEDLPDLPYIIAAILAGLPIVNFTSNQVEIPVAIVSPVMKL